MALVFLIAANHYVPGHGTRGRKGLGSFTMKAGEWFLASVPQVSSRTSRVMSPVKGVLARGKRLWFSVLV